MAACSAEAGTGRAATISTRPCTAEAETRSTFGSRPTSRSIRRSHERQVMPTTGRTCKVDPGEAAAWERLDAPDMT